MTTFRLLPGHHQAVRAAKSRLSTGWRGLFFKPVCQRVTADPKDALDASHNVGTAAPPAQMDDRLCYHAI